MSDPMKVSEVKNKRKFPWERTLVTEAESTPDDVLEEDEEKVPTNVPETWKEVSALKKRVDKLEKIWFIRWFL